MPRNVYGSTINWVPTQTGTDIITGAKRIQRQVATVAVCPACERKTEKVVGVSAKGILMECGPSEKHDTAKPIPFDFGDDGKAPKYKPKGVVNRFFASYLECHEYGGMHRLLWTWMKGQPLPKMAVRT